MFVDFSNRDDVLIIQLSGDLDHHNAEMVRTKIDDKIERDNVSKVVMDFSNVFFMDSSGIGVVIGRYKKIQGIGGKIVIADVNHRVNKIFELSGIYKIIEVYKNSDKAILNF